MQPYFVPYAGYFRLFAASDLFVIYDCVQFPRRGWVHRNRLVDGMGRERWLTLRIEKAPQDALIRELRLAPDAAQSLARELKRFPVLGNMPPSAAPIARALLDVQGAAVDYIERLLRQIVDYLALPWNTLRSSSLAIPASFRGQERIVEIARRLGANAYVNAPGGRRLYDPEVFRAAGLALRFLPEYEGPTASIISRIASEPQAELRAEIIAATQ